MTHIYEEEFKMKSTQRPEQTEAGAMVRRRRPFRFVVEIWRYRVITALLFLIPLTILDKLTFLTVNSSGTPITTANLGQLINWRTPLIVVLGILLILCYIVFEINGQVFLSRDLLMGRGSRIFRELGSGFKSVRRFLSPKGLLVALFITVAVPLCGIGFSISLTEYFYIPNFITSVIFSNTLFTVLYAVAIAALIFLNLRWIFTVHAMLIDDLPAGKAMKRSSALMRANWKDFLKKMLVVSLYSAAIIAASYLLFELLPTTLARNAGRDLPAGSFVDVTRGAALTDLELEVMGNRVNGALSILLGYYVNGIIVLLVSTNVILQMTRLYFRYTGRELQKESLERNRRIGSTVAFITVPVLIVVISVGIGVFFNQLPFFRTDHMPQIIAHRAGGTLASENSLEGIDAAVEMGAYGAETDIQRTKDGAYVINHDNSFGRLTGVNKTPGELTLAEVKELRIRDTTGNGALLEVPTMEEFLDRCNGRIVTFLELKGVNADNQMVDDAVQAIRQRNMQDGAVLISLSYDILDYAEKTYPEFRTGVLIFAGIGEVSRLNCDMIIMEEEMSTPWRIDSIRAAGKQVGVWTVNTEEGLRYFLDSDVDGIITDEVALAARVREELQARSDVQLMKERLSRW